MGATGLEPATFGVTGRVRLGDARRRARSIDVICRPLLTLESSCTAWLSQASDRHLGHEWPRNRVYEDNAALFLSPKTIDFHLRNVYRKVEVRSRTELSRLLVTWTR
jgi:Bacterial regulatory proteins, luxR family